MDRKKFIKNALAGLAGGALLSAGTAAARNKETIGQESAGQADGLNKRRKTMKTVLHKANTRGHADHGWLNSHHTFSFAGYHHPERMQFGALRVLNDDVVAPGHGFDRHPHDNMEIISIPLSGDLVHKDSMGNEAVIREGDIQVLSAGTGIFHSEYNQNSDKEVKFLQIWLFPNKRNIEPRYDQLSIREVAKKNGLYQILSPNPNDPGVWIHQNAWFHMGDFEKGTHQTYQVKREGNGVYAFILEGSADIEGQLLNARDGYGVWDTNQLDIKAKDNTKVLLMDVPMG